MGGPLTEVRTVPAAYPRTAMRPCWDIRWTDQSGAHSALLESRTLVMGSSAATDIVIADPMVSRLHAELDPREDGVWVRDLGSRNGTFIGDVLVQNGRIPSGGRLRLGYTVVSLTDAALPTAVDLWPEESFGALVGRSIVMRELFALLARVAPTDATVLIQGETGTGKEVVAESIHQSSPRATKPFVIVDCGALPPNLLETELFGHVQGAFTGATHPRAGAFESADGGTVFLDEIGELPLAMQPKLLRAIEAGAIRRLGENQYRTIDVRIVSATHRDLRRMVNSGAFREDLFFRLAVVPIGVPALRARSEDIPLLVEHFLREAGAEPLGAALLDELAVRPWLGNVRELRNFVVRATALGGEEALQLAGAGSTAIDPDGAFPPIPFHRPFKEIREKWLEHLEREYIGTLLTQERRDTAAVARLAGLDRAYVYRLMRKHDL